MNVKIIRFLLLIILYFFWVQVHCHASGNLPFLIFRIWNTSKYFINTTFFYWTKYYALLHIRYYPMLHQYYVLLRVQILRITTKPCYNFEYFEILYQYYVLLRDQILRITTFQILHNTSSILRITTDQILRITTYKILPNTSSILRITTRPTTTYYYKAIL